MSRNTSSRRRPARRGVCAGTGFAGSSGPRDEVKLPSHDCDRRRDAQPRDERQARCKPLKIGAVPILRRVWQRSMVLEHRSKSPRSIQPSQAGHRMRSASSWGTVARPEDFASAPSGLGASQRRTPGSRRFYIANLLYLLRMNKRNVPRPAAMALFFFHIIRPDSTFVEDKEGDECADDATAARSALSMAKELASEPNYTGATLIVTDERKKLIAKVLIGEGE